jgi:hypothetical protein
MKRFVVLRTAESLAKERSTVMTPMLAAGLLRPAVPPATDVPSALIDTPRLTAESG